MLMARPLHQSATVMRATMFLATLVSCLLGAACGGDTYCQSGPKYGTQCYSMTDVRSPPGQRPPGAGEPPQWWKTTPPPASYGASQAKPAPPPPPPSTNPTLQRDAGSY
jgi:hypothetical protein